MVSMAARSSAGIQSMIMMEAFLLLSRVVNKRNGPLMKVRRRILIIPLAVKIPDEERFLVWRGMAG